LFGETEAITPVNEIEVKHNGIEVFPNPVFRGQVLTINSDLLINDKVQVANSKQ